MKICYFSNKGIKRINNQDSLLIDTKVYSEVDFNSIICKEIHNKNSIYAIADGMGGLKNGALASSFILKLLCLSYKTTSFNSLKDIIIKLKEKLSLKAILENKYYNSGTTLGGIIFKDDSVNIFNVGDTRIYRIEETSLLQLSEDHTLAMKLFKNGILEKEDLNLHPSRHKLTSCILSDPERDLESVYIKTLKRNKKSRYLICTDGVWEHFRESNINEITRSQPLESLGSTLIEICYKKSNDNISFILIEGE